LFPCSRKKKEKPMAGGAEIDVEEPMVSGAEEADTEGRRHPRARAASSPTSRSSGKSIAGWWLISQTNRALVGGRRLNDPFLVWLFRRCTSKLDGCYSTH
jgi:hypothetical protein